MTMPVPVPQPVRDLRPLARCAVLLNARAKRVDERMADALRSLVGADDVFLSRSLDEAESMARTIIDRGYERVLLGGGDGTIAAALGMLDRAAAAARRTPPGAVILRLGTGNALASLVGAGAPLTDARRALLGHLERQRRPLRVLESPDHPGVVFPFGGLGYDAQLLNDYEAVVARTHTSIGRRFAKSVWGYVYAAFTRSVPAVAGRSLVRAVVESRGRASILDPETTEEIPVQPGATLFEGDASALLVGSTPYYGYGMKVLPHARRRADRFQLRVSTAGVGYVLSRLPALWKGTLRSARLVDFLVEDVTIRLDGPLPLQLSGDAFGRTDHLRVRLAPRAFDLYGPRADGS